MKRHQRYQDDDDFDERGILKDGHACRVSLMDSDSLSPMQLDVARSSVQVVDGQGGTQGLSRPGWRLPANDALLQASDAAYEDYRRALTSAWRGNRIHADAAATDARKITKRDPEGRLESTLEEEESFVRNAATHAESAHRRDHRTVEQMIHDHQNNMAEIYHQLDRELSEKWRRP
jgi:hypothetical protein